MAGIAEDLKRIPMSPGLGATLTRAADYAQAQQHGEVALEHLLLALTEDDDAGQVLSASHVDLALLKADVSTYLGGMDRPVPHGRAGTVSLAGDLKRILEAAAAAASQGRRREINGAIVLAAIVGDGRSSAAHMLRAQGLTFEEAIKALQRALAGGPPPAAVAPRPDAEDVLATARARVQTRSAPPLPPVVFKVAPDPEPETEPELEPQPAMVVVAAAAPKSEPTLEPRSTPWPPEVRSSERGDDFISVDRGTASHPSDYAGVAPSDFETVDAQASDGAGDRGRQEGHHDEYRDAYHDGQAIHDFPVNYAHDQSFVGEHGTTETFNTASYGHDQPLITDYQPPPLPSPLPPPPQAQYDAQSAPPMMTRPPPPLPGTRWPAPIVPAWQDTQLQQAHYQGEGGFAGPPPVPMAVVPPPLPEPQSSQWHGGGAHPTTAEYGGGWQEQQASQPFAAPHDPQPPAFGAPFHPDREPDRSFWPPQTPPQLPTLRPLESVGSANDAGAMAGRQPRRRNSALATGSWQMADTIPRRMRMRAPLVVEVRLALDELRAMAGADTPSMSARLLAPDGGFTIETVAPETVWLDKGFAPADGDFAAWRWTVTPLKRSKRRLVLVTSFRAPAADGRVSAVGLPDQVISVQVATNYRLLMWRVLGWVATATVGAGIAAAVVLLLYPGGSELMRLLKANGW